MCPFEMPPGPFENLGRTLIVGSFLIVINPLSLYSMLNINYIIISIYLSFVDSCTAQTARPAKRRHTYVTMLNLVCTINKICCTLADASPDDDV